jgi:hypothetical protein
MKDSKLNLSSSVSSVNVFQGNLRGKNHCASSFPWFRMLSRPFTSSGSPSRNSDLTQLHLLLLCLPIPLDSCLCQPKKAPRCCYCSLLSSRIRPFVLRQFSICSSVCGWHKWEMVNCTWKSSAGKIWIMNLLRVIFFSVFNAVEDLN